MRVHLVHFPLYTYHLLEGIYTATNTTSNNTLNIGATGILGYLGIANIQTECAFPSGSNFSTSASLVLISALTFTTTRMSSYKFLSAAMPIVTNEAHLTVTASTTTSNVSMTASQIQMNGNIVPSAGIFTTGLTILNYTGGVSALTIQSSNYLVIAEITDPITAATLNLPSNPTNGETHVIKGLHFPDGGGVATLNITTTVARAFEDNKTASPYSMVVSSTADNLRSVTMVYVAAKTSWFVMAGYKN